MMMNHLSNFHGNLCNFLEFFLIHTVQYLVTNSDIICLFILFNTFKRAIHIYSNIYNWQFLYIVVYFISETTPKIFMEFSKRKSKGIECDKLI